MNDEEFIKNAKALKTEFEQKVKLLREEYQRKIQEIIKSIDDRRLSEIRKDLNI